MSVLSDDDREVLAAELAFGLLDADDDAAARARLVEDGPFAASHARWAERATSLLGGWGQYLETPRPSVWPRIVARLPANDTAAPVRLARRWQAATAAATIAAVLLGVAALRPQPTRVVVRQVAVERPRAAPLLAVLTSETERAAVAISVDRQGGRLTLAPARLELGRKVPELWVIPAGGRPYALGVIDARLSGAITPPREALALVQPGATLAISEEPVGGSPTGQPTGRVILAATVATGA